MHSQTLVSRFPRHVFATLVLMLFALVASQTAAAEALRVLPSVGYRPAGNPGGPFGPAMNYTITNNANSPINWTASSTQNWLTFTPASGTALAHGALTTVTVSVNAAANALTPGKYSGTFTIVKQNGNVETHTRSVVLTVRGIWNRQTAAAPWGPREGLATASFQGKLWVMGGRDASGNALNDVWSSPDGLAWTRATASANWSPRSGHRVLVHNGLMWLLGGGDAGVWSTSNGISWTTVTTSAPWGNRSDFGACVFGGQMRVIGGKQDGAGTRDAWRSSNGSTWVRDTASAPWAARSGLGVVGTQSLLYLMGGHGATSFFNDFWQSTNPATNWVKSANNCPWAARSGLAATYYAGNLWLLGGTDATTLFNDAWIMDNSLGWLPAPDAIPWAGRAQFAAQVFGDRLFVLGGLTEDGPAADVWALYSPLQIPKLSVDPISGFGASGNPGGPFAPFSKTYTVVNSGGGTLTWQANLTGATWANLSKTGGTLAAGTSDTLTLSLNANAATLPPKGSDYTGVLQFKNLTNGQGNTQVGVRLEVRGTPPRIQVTPPAGWQPSGPAGGPFTPATQTYTIKNTGSVPMNWQLILTGASWASLSKTAGTLAAGASETVTVALNATAATLPPKAYGYTGVLRFRNLSNGYGNTQVGLKLNVTGTPPRIQVSPVQRFTASGNYGGPFPATQTYTITNTGGFPLTWQASIGGATWASLSKTGGTLAAGASETVTLSVNSTANTLPPKDYGYTGALYFRNLTNSYGNTQLGLKLEIAGTPPSISLTPVNGFESSGPQGGPFTPVSKSYTLRNPGSAPLNWKVFITQPWVAADKTSGTLAAGGEETVTLSLTPEAATLTPGPKTGTILFDDLNSGARHFRSLKLQVLAPL